MRSIILLFLSSALFTICVAQPQKTNTDTSPIDGKNKAPIAWIKNNLTALYSLDGHVPRKSIAQLMLEDDIPGLSIAFVDSNKIAWAASFGFKNLSTSEEVSEQTVFTGASLSKPLAAIAALKAVESGKIDLDENVNNVLDGWKIPDNEFTVDEKVTLRRLIGHSAGIRNDLWSSYLPDEKVPTLTQMLAGQSPSVDPVTAVIFTPGSEVKYSNPGYSIIQKILADVYQDSFDDILETLVFRPSGMQESSFKQPMPAELKERRAVGYDENLKPYPYRLFPYKAAGGVWTTPTDMARFVITLLEDYEGKKNILSPAMMAEVFSRQRERLGFSKIFNDNSEDLIFRHYGSNQGFTSYLVGSLLRKQAVIVMINSDNGFALLDYIARAVAEYYKWDYLKPTIHDRYTAEIPTIGEYQGRFDHYSEILTFNLNEGYLWVTSEKEQTPKKLVPVGNSQFISIDSSVKYEFFRPRGNKDGDIKWVRVTQASGQENWCERVL